MGHLLAALPITNNIDLLGRGGIDFGDDDGLMTGIGIGFHASRQFEIRGEFVARDHVDSLQLNFVFHP